MIDLQELFNLTSSKYTIEEDIYKQYMKQRKLIEQKLKMTNVIIDKVTIDNKNDKLFEQWIKKELKFTIK